MGIHVKLQIEIDNVDDAALLQAVESLVRTLNGKPSTDVGTLVVNETTSTTRRSRKAPKPRFPDATPMERFRLFQEALPERAQRFIELVKNNHPGFLRQSEAIEQLELSSAKAIGGITGSITRWATVDQIALPWVAETNAGERTWRWIGLEAAQRGLNQSIPDVGDVGLSDYQHLSENLFNLLSIVHDAGEIPMDQLVLLMELKNRAALTGLESALKRWVPTRGLPLPIEAVGQRDKRSFRWLARRDAL